MKIEELRIGNTILAMGKVETVVNYIYGEENLIGSTNFADRGVEDFEPLPITEAHLLELGFEKTKQSSQTNPAEWSLKTIIVVDYGNGTYGLDYSDNKCKELYYVHQLQNILIDLL